MKLIDAEQVRELMDKFGSDEIVTFGQLRRLISALPDATPQAQWQPISTAPKDGTDILLRGGKNSGRWIRTAYWAKRTEHWCVDMVGGQSFTEPTHWMPLPPAPGDAP